MSRKIKFEKTLADELQDIIRAFEKADRMGAPTDEPEGTRYVQMSDTIVKKIVRQLVEIRKEVMHESKETPQQ
mgnify:CR=1 FL=1